MTTGHTWSCPGYRAINQSARQYNDVTPEIEDLFSKQLSKLLEPLRAVPLPPSDLTIAQFVASDYPQELILVVFGSL